MSGRLMERWLPARAAHYPTMKAALFVSGEDFLRLALQAHLAARREMVPEGGQRWLYEGPDVMEPLPWASAAGFAEALTRHLDERLRRHAIATGHLLEVPWPEDDDEISPGAGAEPLRSAATDGGASAPGACPPASAVGPASTSAQVADITTPENPLFCASGMQRLPVGDQVDTVEHNPEETA